MAVQLNYIAPPGWQPPNPDQDYLLIQFKIELADFVDKKMFPDATASVAAESSTGTWTKVDEGPESGIKMADEMKVDGKDIVGAETARKIGESPSTKIVLGTQGLSELIGAGATIARNFAQKNP